MKKCCDNPRPVKNKKNGKRRCKSCGEKLKRKSKPRHTKESIDIMQSLRDSGLSCDKVARELKVSPKTVYRHTNGSAAMSLGLSFRKMTPARAKIIRESFAEGIGMKDLAKQFGVTASNIGNIIRGKTFQNAGGPILHGCLTSDETYLRTSLEWVIVNDEIRHISEFAHLQSSQRPDAFCPHCNERVTMVLGKRHWIKHESKNGCETSNANRLASILMNSKFYLFDNLKNNSTLSIKFDCEDCGRQRNRDISVKYDKIYCEKKITKNKPDIILFLNNEKVAVINIQNEKINKKKRKAASSLNVPWIEVEAATSFYSGEFKWRPPDRLPIAAWLKTRSLLCSECRIARREGPKILGNRPKNIRSEKYVIQNGLVDIDEKTGLVTRASNGNILSTKSGGYLVGEFLTPWGCKQLFLHRLVALQYHGDPIPPRVYVNHKNGIKSDNRPENLEWCSVDENCAHAIDIGLVERTLTKDQIEEIRNLNGSISRSEIAKRFGLHVNTIAGIERGELYADAQGQLVEREYKKFEHVAKEIRELNAAGVPRTEISNRFNIGEGHITQIVKGKLFKKAGGPIISERKRKHGNDQFYSELSIMRAEGFSITEITDRTGVDRASVCKYTNRKRGNDIEYQFEKPDFFSYRAAESEIHNKAKKNIGKLLEDGFKPQINIKCDICNKILNTELPFYDLLTYEYIIKLPNRRKRKIDAALIYEDKIVLGIEIFATRKIDNEKAEDLAMANIPWIELDANDILDNANIWHVQNNGNIKDKCSCFLRLRSTS